jgi:hypothetical protein
VQYRHSNPAVLTFIGITMETIEKPAITEVANATAQVSSSYAVSASGKKADQALFSVKTAIETLQAECLYWEQNFLLKTNEELYKILTKSYRLYKQMEGSKAEAVALRKALDDYINLTGVKYRGTTHSMNKIVGCIFGMDRRRVSAYAIALRTALKENIKPDGLIDFFKSKGGIEEVRSGRKANAITVEQKTLVAAKRMEKTILGSFSHQELSKQLDAGEIDKPVVLVGTWNADGSVNIRSVIKSKTAINSALACYYNDKKADRIKEAAEAQQREDHNVLQTAVDSVVAEIAIDAISKAMNG